MGAAKIFGFEHDIRLTLHNTGDLILIEILVVKQGFDTVMNASTQLRRIFFPWSKHSLTKAITP
jgi:hypothetical protein